MNLQPRLLEVRQNVLKQKYPTSFNTADVAVITKMDLAEAVDFDVAAAEANINRVRPRMRILRASAKNGSGIDDWLQFLIELAKSKPQSEAVMKSCCSE